MGRHQVYTGEPSEKKYYLVNNFSGGINTTDVDDVVDDNEFRYLLNMELVTKGMLQNRKGYGNMSIFNHILYNKGIVFPSGRYSLIKVVKNTRNVFEKLEEYSSIDEFLNAMKPLDYVLHILIFFNNTVNLLKMEKSIGKGLLEDIVVTYTLLYTIPVNALSYKNYTTSVKTVDYGDNVYFTLSEISEDFIGIGNYSIANESFSVIDIGHSYQPTPYEVCNKNGMTGFNVLSNNPLTYIADQGVGIKEVLGIFITKINSDTPLDRIPQDDFVINVVHTGSTFHPAELKFVFKDHEDNILNYRIVSMYDKGGFFSYIITGLNLTNVTHVTINVVKNDDIKHVANIAALSPFKGIAGDNYVTVRNEDAFYKKLVNATGYNITDYTRYKVTIKTKIGIGWELSTVEYWQSNGIVAGNYDIIADTSDDLLVPAVVGVAARIYNSNGEYVYYKSTYLNGSDIIDPSLIVPATLWSSYMVAKYNNVYFEVYNDTNSRVFKYDDVNKVFTEIVTLSVNYANINEVIPQVGDIIVIDDTAEKYYVMLRRYYGDARDFEEINYSQEEIINSLLGQYYDIGVTVNAHEVKAVDLTNVKIFIVGDRLVYYKGNTLWFSELAQFDYLPNRNFVILPIQSDDEITTINYFRNCYIIFTKEKIFRMSGIFETDTFRIELINEFVGCIAPNTVRYVNNALLFMSAQGMYQLTSSNYTDGLENVKKLDKRAKGLIPLTEFVDSVLYNEQYWLILRNNLEYDVVKYYYNIDTRDGQHPFTVDKYAMKPKILFNNGVNLYSINNGEFFVYDKDYTDLMPSDTLSSNIDKYVYSCKIRTINNSFNYPTHDKKYANIYVKTYSSSRILLYFTIKIDEYVKLSPKRFNVIVNELGEIEYREYLDEDAGSNLILDTAALDNFELNKDVLGDNPQELHKVIISSKGKTIALEIEAKANGYFSIVDIGYLYKLGKVRESK